MKKGTIKPQPDTALKVSLSIPDRINFATILPVSGSIAENALGESLIKRISIPEAETKEAQLQFSGSGKFVYNPMVKSKEFAFELHELLYIQQGARYHDTNKLLKPYNYKLAERLLSIKIES